MPGSPEPSRRRRSAGSLALCSVLAATVAACGSTSRPVAPAASPGTVMTTTRSAATIAAATTTSPAAVAPPPSVPRPRIAHDPIPFGARRKREMVAYAERHYGLSTYRLIDPKVIVIHYTETSDFQAAYNTFAPDQPDSELHELPAVCAHFVIDQDGVIHQLVPVSIMCRHTVGLNWTAIGIEHVGFSDAQVLDNRREIDASLRLTRWLRCRFGIAVKNVIGHNESLSSPYHRENVSRLRTQTHDDFKRADMQRYRRLLARAGGCS